MDYFFQLINGQSNSQSNIEMNSNDTINNDSDANENTTENTTTDDQIVSRLGFAIPIAAIIFNTYPQDNTIRGDLNGTDLSNSIDTLDDTSSNLFMMNIQPNNLELLKRLNQTILMYRKDKLTEITHHEKIDCCICFTDKEYSVHLKCSHKFCLDCVLKIVFESNRNTCPLCRDIFIN